jgi:hypothetical protein
MARMAFCDDIGLIGSSLVLLFFHGRRGRTTPRGVLPPLSCLIVWSSDRGRRARLHPLGCRGTLGTRGPIDQLVVEVAWPGVAVQVAVPPPSPLPSVTGPQVAVPGVAVPGMTVDGPVPPGELVPAWEPPVEDCPLCEVPDWDEPGEVVPGTVVPVMVWLGADWPG